MGYYKKNLPFSKFVAAEYKNENQNDYTFCVQLVKDATEDNPVLEFELYPPYEEKPKMEKVTENLKWVFKLQYPNGKKKQVDVKKFLDKFGVGRATIEKYTEVKGKDGKPIYYEVELKRIMPCYNSNKTWSDIIRDFRDFKKKTNLSDIAKRGNMLKKYLGDMNYFHEDRLEMITKYMIDSFYKYQFERTRCEQLLAVFDSNNPYYAKDVKDYLSFDEKKKENMRICVDKLLRKNAPYIDLHTDFDIFKVYAKSCLRVYVEVDDFLMGLAEIRCSETDKEEYLESLKVRMYRLCKKNNIPWME